MPSETYVLDSYAVMALLGGEEGCEDVAQLLREAEQESVRLLMTWVNAGEVAYIVERRWGRERMYEALAALEATAIEFVPVGRDLALRAAAIKAEHPVAYADAHAAGLAALESATVLTGDPEFRQLEDVVTVRWIAGER